MNRDTGLEAVEMEDVIGNKSFRGVFQATGRGGLVFAFVSLEFLRSGGIDGWMG